MSGEGDDEGCVECFVEGDDLGYGEGGDEDGGESVAESVNFCRLRGFSL